MSSLVGQSVVYGLRKAGGIKKKKAKVDSVKGKKIYLDSSAVLHAQDRVKSVRDIEMHHDFAVVEKASMSGLIQRLEEAKSPRGRKNLLGYFSALHDQLDKEFNYSVEELAAMSISELKRETKSLESHLSRAPNGEESVKFAKNNAAAAYKMLARTSGGALK